MTTTNLRKLIKQVESNLRSTEKNLKNNYRLIAAGFPVLKVRTVIREQKKLITQLNRELAKLKKQLRQQPKRKVKRIKLQVKNANGTTVRSLRKIRMNSKPIDETIIHTEVKPVIKPQNTGMTKGAIKKQIRAHEDKILSIKNWIAQDEELFRALWNSNRRTKNAQAVLKEYVRDLRSYKNQIRTEVNGIWKLKEMIDNGAFIRRTHKTKAA